MRQELSLLLPLSRQELLLCLWDFSWERGAVQLLSPSLDCDFWVGHCDFSRSGFSWFSLWGWEVAPSTAVPGAPRCRGGASSGAEAARAEPREAQFCAWFGVEEHRALGSTALSGEGMESPQKSLGMAPIGMLLPGMMNSSARRKVAAN